MGLDNVLADNRITVNIDWQSTMLKTEKDMTMERQYSTIYYKNTEEAVDYLSAGKDDAKEIKDQKLQWVSFKAGFLLQCVDLQKWIYPL